MGEIQGNLHQHYILDNSEARSIFIKIAEEAKEKYISDTIISSILSVTF